MSKVSQDRYRPRLVDDQIDHMLSSVGAVHIKGPKWCGKTTTAERHANSILRLQDPLDPVDYREIAKMNMSLLLQGKTPKLIDEWQTIPEIWNAVRNMVDRRGANGQFILTGSSLIPDAGAGVLHSGAGRIAPLQMRTMSLFESGESNGSVTLSSLFDKGQEVASMPVLTIDDISHILVRGGWPSTVVQGGRGGEAVGWYCDAILDSGIYVDGRKRNRQKMASLLRSLSRNIATGASNPTILEDMSSDDELPEGDIVQEDSWSQSEDMKAPMSIDTMRNYMDALRSICLVEDMPAWSPKLRSKTAVRTSDTRYLTDPSIAAYFLGASAEDLMFDPETFGQLFENLAVRDLRVYSQAIGGEVRHYRDKTGLEVDSVIHLRDGRWGAVEIKLSSKNFRSGAKNLIALKDKVDESERNKLSFLTVLTGDGYAYTDEIDGEQVHSIPIGCLRN